MILRSSEQITQEKYSVVSLIIFLAVLTLYRILALINADLSLFFDEAYYFFWSQTLAFGYYSKPPLIAWVIAIVRTVCGESELCLRLPALLVHPFTALGLFLIGKILYEIRIGWWTAIIYATLPMISASSWIISTDALLLLFWTYGLWFLILALINEKWRNWLGFGICLGLGLLTKYTMLFFVLSLILYFVISDHHRHHLINFKFYFALIIGFVIFFPNILWNINHGWVSLHHTAQNIAFDNRLFNPVKLIEFIVGQILVFGPVLSVVLPAAVLNKEVVTTPKAWRRLLLLTLSLPLLAAISVEALIVRANANWAAPSYLGLTLLVVVWLLDYNNSIIHEANKLRSKNYWLTIAIMVNILIMGIGYHYDDISRFFNIKPTRSFDPYARLRGWRELAERVQEMLINYPTAGILGEERLILAELGYYLRIPNAALAVWNPSAIISDHYRLIADIKYQNNREYLFITRETEFKSIAANFAEAQDLGIIRIATHRDSVIECRIYWLRNFLGYNH